MARLRDQKRVLIALLGLLVLSTALAGCHGFDDDGTPGPSDGDGGGDGTNGDGDGTNNTTPPPPPPDDGDGDDGGNGGENGGTPRKDLTLTPQNPPSQKIAGDASSLTVQVTGDTAQATSAGIRWATSSTANTAPEQLTPSQLPGNRAASGSSFNFPGEYAVTGWTLTAGTYYVRAHIVVEGQNYWSTEFVVTVVPEIENVGSAAADQTVNIQTTVTNPCAGDAFSPANVQVTAGQTVRWRNQATCAHTATSGSSFGSPDGKFDTGSISTNGGTSPTFKFNKAGTYSYYCAFHNGMAVATVTVA
jgi:plastocyanin